MKQPKYIYILESILSKDGGLNIECDNICNGFSFDMKSLLDKCILNIQLEDIDSCDNLFYYIRINKVSLNSRLFDNTDELMDYVNSNYKKQTTDTLYDFLMSLVECESYYYDLDGNLINKEIIMRDDYAYFGDTIEFDENLCSQGKFKFFLGTIDTISDKSNYDWKYI